MGLLARPGLWRISDLGLYQLLLVTAGIVQLVHASIA